MKITFVYQNGKTLDSEVLSVNIDGDAWFVIFPSFHHMGLDGKYVKKVICEDGTEYQIG